MHLFSGMMFGLILPLVALDILLIVVALIDLIRREPSQVNGNKVLWGLVIVFIGTLGPICYFLLGRKEAEDVHP